MDLFPMLIQLVSLVLKHVLLVHNLPTFLPIPQLLELHYLTGMEEVELLILNGEPQVLLLELEI